MSEICCTQLAGNTGRKKIAICAPSHNFVHLYLRNWGTYRQSERNLLNSSISPHAFTICLQHGELRPTSGWDLLATLGHPNKFQRVSRLGSVTARHSSSGRYPNFAALNRGRHIYSAGRPSRLALAHISGYCWNTFLKLKKTSPLVYTFQYSCDVRPDFRIQPRWYSADSIEKSFDLKISLNTTKYFNYIFMKHRCISYIQLCKVQNLFNTVFDALLCVEVRHAANSQMFRPYRIDKSPPVSHYTVPGSYHNS